MQQPFFSVPATALYQGGTLRRRDAARGGTGRVRTAGQRRQDWGTPQELYDALDREFHFELDVCANEENGKAAASRTGILTEDGLAAPWGRQRCWMNPPYGRSLGRWVEKAALESATGALVICLLPSRTDTEWWHRWVLPFAAEVRFLKGRLRFEGARDRAPFPSVVVIFAPRPSVSLAEELEDFLVTRLGQRRYSPKTAVTLRERAG